MISVHRPVSEHTHLFTEETLEEDDADGPDVYLGGDFGGFTTGLKAFRRQIPVCAGALGGKVHARVWIVQVLGHQFTQSEIRDLDLTRDLTRPQENIS